MSNEGILGWKLKEKLVRGGAQGSRNRSVHCYEITPLHLGGTSILSALSKEVLFVSTADPSLLYNEPAFLSPTNLFMTRA